MSSEFKNVAKAGRVLGVKSLTEAVHIAQREAGCHEALQRPDEEECWQAQAR
jgi:hypothetical protein